ncbi:hypothetical protein EJ02DRAFT_425516 [Clathrospora elynae]|uniref:Uncharacterized protein n=1 Tax=Clathrospora elynae TaxID=706981 RepID=A0A6A5SG32_9PLEO|nr:hypothetical protein EJ02DRAFT_425516 [Clathrospora elynae]
MKTLGELDDESMERVIRSLREMHAEGKRHAQGLKDGELKDGKANDAEIEDGRELKDGEAKDGKLKDPEIKDGEAEKKQ